LDGSLGVESWRLLNRENSKFFLREKLYADFRHDPDKAFNDVDRALAKFTNPVQGRTESPNWNTDWSTSWGTFEDDPDRQAIELTFVDHGPGIPYTIMSQCRISCNPKASRLFAAAMDKEERDIFIRDVLTELMAKLDPKEMTIIIDGPRPKFVTRQLAREDGQHFLIELSARRMGNDNGMDTAYYLDNNLERALDHMNQALRSKTNVFREGN
jgi:hypothetical protein